MPSSWRLVMLTIAALLGFSANSVLARMGLSDGATGAADFTLLRMVAGAGVLAFLARPRLLNHGQWSGDWLSAVALGLYAVAFSFAYLALHTGIGALILFGAVQVTMIGWGVLRGERPGLLRWCGLLLALGGLVALTLPGASAPPLLAASGMAIAGGAWGVYSLRGRTVSDALSATAGNFLRVVPLVLVVWVASGSSWHASTAGAVCALISGAITSALGYACWYTVLPSLSRTTAAIVQLSVPVLAALAGVLLLNEPLTLRLLIVGAVVLIGIACATLSPPSR